MGFWDKLFGKKKNNEEAAATQVPARQEAVPADQEEEKPTSSAAGEMEKPVEEPAAPQPAETTEEDVIRTETEESVPAQESESREPVAAEMELAEKEAAESAAEMEKTTSEQVTAQWPEQLEPALRKRLETYFARLEELYPDKVIVRLNTGHKKLAERGAELRRLAGMEGELDRFFALGGFVYKRSEGGRPPLPLTEADCEEMRRKLKELFPQGIPVVMAVRDADSRLYLDLRAVARRENMNVGDYLRRYDLMAKKPGSPETVMKS